MAYFGFGGRGTPGSGGWVSGVILVLRTFPASVWRSVQNFMEIGTAVHMGKRFTGTYIYTNSLFN